MSSRQTGAQRPRIKLEPKRVSSDGADVAKLASAYGLTPDKWQQDILDVWMGRNSKDKFTATSCGLSVPRQNGKNAILEMRELYGLCVIGERILHTAHEVKTAAESFRRLAGFFENKEQYPELAEMLVRVRRTNGQEAIELTNGAIIRFSARSKGAARGMTFDLVVFDEAQYLTDDHIEAMMPTMAAAPLGNRQLIYTGTPPDPFKGGDVFGRVRKRALKKPGRHLAWHEWSVAKIGDVKDKARWYTTNPAMGIRLDEDAAQEECKTMTNEGFARERLGFWSDATSVNAVFTPSMWKGCVTDSPPASSDKERFAAGIKFTPDGANVALSMAVKSPNRKNYIECLEYAPMTGGMVWLSEWLLERKNKIAVVAVDGKSNTAALVQKLIDGGFPKRGIRIMSSNDVCAAASMFYNAVKENSLEHTVQPLLDESAIYSQKRNIGNNGGWGFGTGTVDSAPIESASLAYFGVMTTKRNPARKMRVG